MTSNLLLTAKLNRWLSQALHYNEKYFIFHTLCFFQDIHYPCHRISICLIFPCADKRYKVQMQTLPSCDSKVTTDEAREGFILVSSRSSKRQLRHSLGRIWFEAKNRVSFSPEKAWRQKEKNNLTYSTATVILTQKSKHRAV